MGNMGNTQNFARSKGRAMGTKLLALNANHYRVGETHHRAKLTDAQVDEMRDLHEDDGVGYRTLAKRFNVSKSTVRDICNYRTRAQTPEHWAKPKEPKP